MALIHLPPVYWFTKPTTILDIIIKMEVAGYACPSFFPALEIAGITAE
jgi:hypothetical protein